MVKKKFCNRLKYNIPFIQQKAESTITYTPTPLFFSLFLTPSYSLSHFTLSFLQTYRPALVMIISVVDLWNSAHRSSPCKVTLVPFGATDSAVVEEYVIVVPVSAILMTVPGLGTAEQVLEHSE